MFEVTPEGEIVWEYINPHHGEQRPRVFANGVFRAYRYAAILRKPVGAWARLAHETGVAIRVMSTNQTQKAHERQRGT